MNSSNTCPFCGKKLRGGGRYSNFILCYVCKIKTCTNCSKYGFCPEHYNDLSDAQKKKIKSNNSSFNVFKTAIPILYLLIIIPFVLLNPNIIMDSTDKTIQLFGFIFVVLLVVYITLMNHLKNKKVYKMLQGFEV